MSYVLINADGKCVTEPRTLAYTEQKNKKMSRYAYEFGVHWVPERVNLGIGVHISQYFNTEAHRGFDEKENTDGHY